MTVRPEIGLAHELVMLAVKNGYKAQRTVLESCHQLCELVVCKNPEDGHIVTAEFHYYSQAEAKVVFRPHPQVGATAPRIPREWKE